MTYKRSALMQSRIQQNKETIFAATKQLISEGGFKNAQITAIAEIAGVSNGLVYRYFKNKSQLMMDVLTEVSDTEIGILNSIADSDLPVDQKLHKAVRVFVKRALNDPHMAYALMLEPVEDAEFNQARIMVKANIAKPIERILKQGKTEGVFLVNDIKIAALCIVGAMTYSVIEPLNANNSASQIFPSEMSLAISHENYRAYFSQEVADFCLTSARVLVH